MRSKDLAEHNSQRRRGPAVGALAAPARPLGELQERPRQGRRRLGTHTHTHTGCDTVGETLTFILKYALTVTSTSRCIFAKAESQRLCPGEGLGQWVGRGEVWGPPHSCLTLPQHLTKLCHFTSFVCFPLCCINTKLDTLTQRRPQLQPSPIPRDIQSWSRSVFTGGTRISAGGEQEAKTLLPTTPLR